MLIEIQKASAQNVSVSEDSLTVDLVVHGDVILREKVNELLDGGQKDVLLNLEKVSYMDSAGIGELRHELRRDLRRRGGHGDRVVGRHLFVADGAVGGDIDGVAFAAQLLLQLIAQGVFVFNDQGMEGAIFQMVAHGVITGALFLLVGVIYERTHDRTIAKMGGLGQTVPVFATLMVFFSLASAGLPSSDRIVLCWAGVRTSAIFLTVASPTSPACRAAPRTISRALAAVSAMRPVAAISSSDSARR